MFIFVCSTLLISIRCLGTNTVWLEIVFPFLFGKLVFFSPRKCEKSEMKLSANPKGIIIYGVEDTEVLVVFLMFLYQCGWELKLVIVRAC